MTIPDQLRKLAAQLRETAKQQKEKKRTKCASILNAAQGISRLREAIYGEQK